MRHVTATLLLVLFAVSSALSIEAYAGQVGADVSDTIISELKAAVAAQSVLIDEMKATVATQASTIDEHARLIRELIDPLPAPLILKRRELVVETSGATRIDHMSMSSGQVITALLDGNVIKAGTVATRTMNASVVVAKDLHITGDLFWQGLRVGFDRPTPVPTPAPSSPPSAQPTLTTVRSCSDNKLKVLGRASGVYQMTDGSFRECDMATAGGGWTLVARVSDDYSWVCPEAGGGDCMSASPSLVPASNLWHASHWASSVTLAPGATGLASGVSTNPALVRTYRGSTAWDIRFSFYNSKTDTVAASEGYMR